MDRRQCDPSPSSAHAGPTRRALLGGVAGSVLGALVWTGSARAAQATATPASRRTQKRLVDLNVLSAGLKWIESRPNENGALLDSGGKPDASTTAAVVSLLIALRNVGVHVDLNAAVAYLEKSLPTKLTESTPYDQAAAIALALAAADPRNLGDDLLAWLAAAWTSGTTISGSDGVLRLIAFGMLAVAAAGRPIDERAIAGLGSRQIADGSWDAYGAMDSESGDAITTALIIQAMVAAGHGRDDMVANAVGYFRTLQVDGGAFALAPGEPPDAYSTAAIISALIALGQNPKAKNWGQAVSGLLAFQNKNGAFRYTDDNRADDITITIWALTALAGAHWPVLPIA